MAWENLEGIYSLPAAVDLSANQYQAVVANASGQFALCGLGAIPDGILHNLPKAGEQARAVTLHGVVVKMKAGAAISLGGFISSDATGRAVTSVTTGHARFGKALRAAGAAGDIIEVLYLGWIGNVP